MFIIFYLLAWIAILLGAWCINMNAKPYLWQIVPFVVALLIMPFLTGYGHKRLVIVLCFAAVIGLVLACLQINGFIDIGQSSMLPPRE
ncbi:hypothetical protein [Photobacterium japonica]|uniref:hypothetical protein n=1 Tax=Photobacterium japonica TaxID=2910235 RepID=UPI003D0B8443